MSDVVHVRDYQGSDVNDIDVPYAVTTKAL
jgi:hypothetical protein